MVFGDGKKTCLTRKTRAVCNCYVSSLVSQDSESVVADRRLFINDPTCEGASSNLGLMPPQGPHEAFLSDSRSSLSLIKRLKLFQARALSNFFVSLRNRVSGSVDVGRRARALVSVQSLTNCRLFVKLHLWMRSQSREASLNTTSPLHLHRRYT